MRQQYEPVVLTVAITGGDVLPSQHPRIPKGVAEIVEEAVAVAKAGATCVHIHARELDGRPSAAGKLFSEIAEGIRSRCDVVLNFTTGGAPGMSPDERLEGVFAGRPEIASFNLGTMNMETFPTKARWPVVENEWERAVLERSGEVVFSNTLNMLRRFAMSFRELGITPELEAYDLGQLHTARFLLDEGTLEGPLRVQLVLGVLGGAGNRLEDLFILKQAAEQILGSDLMSLGVAALGYPMQFRHAAVALSCGMDFRVGFEDSLRVRRDRKADSNVEFVEVATELAVRLGRPIATPTELRNSLGPWFHKEDKKSIEQPASRD
jgi:uncharacterized protein (DUF849 family)